MKKKKNILIVNWGILTAEFPLRETIELNKYNVFLACTGEMPKPIEKLFSKENLVITNPYDCQILIQDVVKFIKEKKIEFEIVTTFFEMNVYQTAVLADFLKCKAYLSPANALKTSVNKGLMRQEVKKADLNQPQFLVFDKKNQERAFDFYQKIRKAVVVKPVHSGHSYGSRFIDKGMNHLEFDRQVDKARDELKIVFDEWMEYEKDFDNYYLIEEYIDGRMISFDGVVGKKGKCKFIGSLEFDLTPLPLLQQIGHTTPVVSLSRSQVSRCKEHVEKIIRVIGLQYCGFHCELKINKNKIYLIEIAGRLPGGVVLETYQTVSKTNIFDQFFSVFETDSKESFKLNKHVYQSESRIGMYCFSDYGRISQILTPERTDNRIIKTIISLVKQGEVFYLEKKSFAKLLMLVKFQSKKLLAKEILKKRNEFIKQVKIEIDRSKIIKIKFKLKLWRDQLKRLVKGIK